MTPRLDDGPGDDGQPLSARSVRRKCLQNEVDNFLNDSITRLVSFESMKSLVSADGGVHLLPIRLPLPRSQHAFFVCSFFVLSFPSFMLS